MKQLLSTILVTCLLITLATACIGPKEIAVELPERSFILGSGGGVTGAYDIYRIFNTGKVEQQNADFVTFSFLKTLPIDSVRACFHALDELQIEDYSFNHPGNMTYIIKLENSDGINTINWGAADKNIRKDIKDYFKRIRAMIRTDYK